MVGLLNKSTAASRQSQIRSWRLVLMQSLGSTREGHLDFRRSRGRNILQRMRCDARKSQQIGLSWRIGVAEFNLETLRILSDGESVIHVFLAHVAFLIPSDEDYEILGRIWWTTNVAWSRRKWQNMIIEASSSADQSGATSTALILCLFESSFRRSSLQEQIRNMSFYSTK